MFTIYIVQSGNDPNLQIKYFAQFFISTLSGIKIEFRLHMISLVIITENVNVLYLTS